MLYNVAAQCPSTGYLTFIGKTKATHLTLAGDLTVASLNGLQVEVAARELVLNDQNATIRGPHALHLAQNSTGDAFDILSFFLSRIPYTHINTYLNGSPGCGSSH